MQLADFYLEETKLGLFHTSGNFFVDPKFASDVAVITHAHADHAIKGNKLVYCTKPTQLLMQARYGKSAAGSFITLDFLKPFSINKTEIIFYPAGHMLGSACLLIKEHNKTVLVTGDIKMQPDSSCESLQLPQADLLITESTFANPLTKHPDVAEEIKQLSKYCDKNIIVGVYAMGKAQRLTKLIGEHCPEFTIMIHPSIIPFHHVYENAGINLGKWLPYNRQQFKHTPNIIYLTTPISLQTFYRNPKVYTAFASGWNHLQKRSTINLSISDHADWDDLLKIIETVKPSYIKTVHGDGAMLKSHFNETKSEITFID